MLRPVGSQPPSVYWRRRIFVIGSVVLLLVLIVLTVKAFTSNSDAGHVAGGTGSSATVPASTPASSPPSTSASARSSHPQRSPSHSGSSSVPPARCVTKDLAVTGVVGKTDYSVGDQPLLELQVSNTGAKPCVQDLADKEIELKVYNGESRVWGSHDCKIQPGTDDMTLAVNTPVRVAITWSGLTSQPGCKGTRQRVGAGTYTLYALLSGKTGKATQFTIS